MMIGRSPGKIGSYFSQQQPQNNNIGSGLNSTNVTGGTVNNNNQLMNFPSSCSPVPYSNNMNNNNNMLMAGIGLTSLLNGSGSININNNNNPTFSSITNHPFS